MKLDLPFNATIDEYDTRARMLYDALRSGDEEAAWRFKWEHPAFRGKSIEAVRSASLQFQDARKVIARNYAFEKWQELEAFTKAVNADESVNRFERAVEAVVTGDVTTLRSILDGHPEIVHARSTRQHRATLLHYIAANGVEGGRQKTPRNAVEVVRMLLDAGAEVDALADMYENKCTTMSMLVSSSPPHEAGLQSELAETLLEYGAALDGPGSKWSSVLMTTLAFGFTNTAERLAERAGTIDNLPVAAGLGRVAEAERLLPDSDDSTRHVALALAAQNGRAEMVRLLLASGVDPNRYNPEGYHSHSTPLHQAVWADHLDVVRRLAEGGARLDIRDTIYNGTPLDWAIHGERRAVADFLRNRQNHQPA